MDHNCTENCPNQPHYHALPAPSHNCPLCGVSQQVSKQYEEVVMVNDTISVLASTVSGCDLDMEAQYKDVKLIVKKLEKRLRDMETNIHTLVELLSQLFRG